MKHLRVLFAIIFPFFLFSQDDLQKIRKELEIKKDEISKTSSSQLLNVSYDPTREFYENYNRLFEAWWKEKTNQIINILQSHGGSGTQARAVISGLEADVVSLALGFDIDMIQKMTGAIGFDWQKRLPNNSSPYFSTIVFLVRKDNPKNIKDWDDLIKEGISIIIPNPKTSGGARWAYMAAWAFAIQKFEGDETKAKEFMRKIFRNAPFLDTGARGATTTFVQKQIGDVLLTWENEAYLTKEKLGSDNYNIIYPSLSIKAEPPVTWVEKFAKENKNEDLAKLYVKYLYSVPSQKLIAQYHFRPYDFEIRNAFKDKFPDLKMVSINDFGGWEKVQKKHFSDSGIFDEIYP